MSNGIISMSRKEVDRLGVIQRIQSKQISQVEASQQLDLSSRQVRRLLRKFEEKGAKGLVSKRRGSPSNNRLDTTLSGRVIELIKKHYHDFGPTFAHEKLTEQHKLKLSIESTRQIMMHEGIWQGKKHKSVTLHQQRARRSCLGELVQIDGSPHDWFEGRSPRCTLLVFIDDATSQLMTLHFAEEETTEAYFTATREHLKRHGRPLAYYSDRHGIFRVNIREAATGTGETQFSRAMRELDIELICANSPQAKGRVERANATLQDRLIKEMRLRGISNIEAANAFLSEFIEDYNRRFSVAPANSTDAHRASTPTEETLNLIFSEQHPRTISKNLEVSYKNVVYQIQTSTPGYTMRGAKLTVCECKTETTLLYKSKALPYKIFDKKNQPSEVVSSKQLLRPKKVRHAKPKANHPWRHYPNKNTKQTQPITAIT